MGGMSFETLFPVATLVMGYAGAALTELFRDKRLAKRERDARKEARRDGVQFRRVEFQRETLLALQDAIAKLARNTGASFHQDSMAFRRVGTWGVEKLPDNLSDEGLQAVVAVNILGARVLDERLRSLCKSFRASCVEVGLARSEADAERFLRKMSEEHETLSEHLGTVLRGIDSDEDELLR